MKDTAQTALTLAKRTQARAIFLVLLAGSLWGCIGLFSRTLSALGVGPESIVILRNAGACVVLAVLFLVYDRSIFRIQLRHFPIFLGTGIVSILFFTLLLFQQPAGLFPGRVGHSAVHSPDLRRAALGPVLAGEDHEAEAPGPYHRLLRLLLRGGAAGRVPGGDAQGPAAGHRQRPVLQLLYALWPGRAQPLPALYRDVLYVSRGRDRVLVFDPSPGAGHRDRLRPGLSAGPGPPS